MQHARNRSQLRHLDLSKAGFLIGPESSKYIEPNPGSACSAELANYPPPLKSTATVAFSSLSTYSGPLRNALNTVSSVSSINIGCIGSSSRKESKSLRTVKRLLPKSSNPDAYARKVLDENGTFNYPEHVTSVKNYANSSTARDLEVTSPPKNPSSVETREESITSSTAHSKKSPDAFSGCTFFFSYENLLTESDQCLVFTFQGQLIPEDIDLEEGIDEFRYCNENFASPTSRANSEQDFLKFQLSLL